MSWQREGCANACTCDRTPFPRRPARRISRISSSKISCLKSACDLYPGEKNWWKKLQCVFVPSPLHGQTLICNTIIFKSTIVSTENLRDHEWIYCNTVSTIVDMFKVDVCLNMCLNKPFKDQLREWRDLWMANDRCDSGSKYEAHVSANSLPVGFERYEAWQCCLFIQQQRWWVSKAFQLTGMVSFNFSIGLTRSIIFNSVSDILHE